MQAQQGHDQCHADVNAVLHLLKVSGTGVIVHIQCDLVHAGQGMQHSHIRLCKAHLFLGEDVAVLQADVVLLVEEALALHAGHVEDVELGHDGGEVGLLGVLQALGLEHVLLDVAG